MPVDLSSADRSAAKRRQLAKLIGFVVAGGTGFIVDAGVLFLGINTFGLGALAARGISFTAAVITTWLINRSITFAQQRGRRGRDEIFLYILATLASGALNLGVYALVLHLVGDAGWRPFAALVLGVGAGLVSNFLLYNFVVFRPPKT
ncbi:GtrA family protein [Chelatococcus sp. GCM10030263]|uniref:GtrA family protein n=1 Tax=Chelatococcus sp. GCM10030263 TaxID=3273387 RepID=UPI00360B728C